VPSSDTLILFFKGSVVALLSVGSGDTTVQGFEGVSLRFLSAASDNTGSIAVNICTLIYVDVGLAVFG